MDSSLFITGARVAPSTGKAGWSLPLNAPLALRGAIEILSYGILRTILTQVNLKSIRSRWQSQSLAKVRGEFHSSP
jgi:hypothetical protein